MSDMSRRDFVTAVTTVACALTVGGVTAFAAQPAGPGGAKPPAIPAGEFDAGDATKLTKGINDKFAKTKGVFIVRDDKDYLYAMSSVCTHQGGSLNKATDGLMCPKHKATFDKEGKVTKGPAKQQLSRYNVTLKDGHLWVDTSKIFLPGEFAKDGAWVQG